MSKRDTARTVAMVLAGSMAMQGFSWAEVRLDGSMGPALSLPGPHFRIEQRYGQTVGGNLFHSFSAFNLYLGDAATFFGSPAIGNVIARVTGGVPSAIDGLLTSAIPGANLWFINPNGVLFGPHASVDVDGSFYVSTANTLRFADGVRLEMTAGTPPVLSSAPPEAFGFLTDHPAPVHFYGSGSDAARAALADYYASGGLHWNGMAVREGKTFAVVAGDINIQDGRLYTGETVAGKLQAPSGRIALVSAGSAGEVKPNAPGVDTGGFAREGKITLSSGNTPEGAVVSASGPGGGEIVIRGGELVARNAFLVSDTGAEVDGKRIDIKVRGNMDLAANGAGVYARSFGAGKAPDIAISARNLHLSDTALISGGSAGTGAGGRIHIEAEDAIRIQSGSGVTSLAASRGAGGTILLDAASLVLDRGTLLSAALAEGAGGGLEISARDIALAGGSFIIASTGRGSRGDGGGLSVRTDTLRLSGGAAIRSDKGDYSTGKGGPIVIAAQSMVLSEASEIASFAGNASTGEGGPIRISTGDLAVRGDSAITGGSGLAGTARGGSVTVEARGTVRLAEGSSANNGIFSNAADGDAGALSISARDLVLENGGTVGADNLGAGRGADIVIHAGTVTLSSDPANPGSPALISAKPNNLLGRVPTGAPGNITIVADSLRFSGPRSGITTANLGGADAGTLTVTAGSLHMADGSRIEGASLGRGRASDFRLNVGRVVLKGGAQIDSSSYGQGRAGDIDLVAAEGIGIEGDSRDRRGGIYSAALGSGDAGKIVILTPELRLRAFGEVSTATAGRGRGGDIQVRDARRVDIQGPGGLFTSTHGEGQAGAVEVSARTLSVSGGGVIDASTWGGGAAGRITLVADKMIVEGGAISSSTVGPGSGGVIDIGAGALTVSLGGAINVSTQGPGAAGRITLHADSVSLNSRGTVSSSTNGAGDGGTIDITADRLSLSDNARITASAHDAGAGGRIQLKANQSIAIENGPDGISSVISSTNGTGRAGAIAIDTPRLEMDGISTVETTTLGDGDAGDVTVRADTVALKNGAQIGSGSGIVGVQDLQVYAGRGRGGTVTIRAGELRISGQATTDLRSGVFSQTAGGGPGGSISVEASRLALAGRGWIGADTAGDAPAGRIDIHAGSVKLESGAEISSGSGIAVGGRMFAGKGRGGTVAVVSDGELALAGAGTAIATDTQGGGSAGDIAIRARNIRATVGAAITSSALGPGDAGNVTVAATDRLDLAGTGTRIATETRQSGRGGSIDLSARDVAIGEGAVATAAGSGSGDSGRIAVRAGASLDLAGTISTNTAAQGNAGEITVAVPELRVTGGEIRSSSQAGASGRAGNLAIAADRASFSRGGAARVETHDGPGGRIELAARHLALTEGGTISTTTRGGGTAGDIAIRDAEDVTVAGAGAGRVSRITLDTEGSGNGGNLTLATRRLSVRDGGSISATAGAGATGATRGGSLDIRAGGVEVADRGTISAATSGFGAGGRVRVSATRLVVAGRGEISAATQGAGDAGDVSIASTSVGLRGGGRITSAAGAGGGNGGRIDIHADTVAIAGGGAVSATTGGAGQGGTIRIRAGELSLDSGGTVAAGSSGSGRGGDVRIAAGHFRLDREGTVSATARGAGQGGDIRIAAGEMDIRDGRISTLSTGTGDAGNIRIDAGERLTSRGGRITARGEQADGGSISLAARDRIHLVDSEVTASVRGGAGQGGNIFIDPHWVILDNSRITANAWGGPGGNIRIVADQFIRSGDSVVDASSRFGVNGNVLVESPETNILGKIKALAAQYLDAAALFKTPCAARYAQGESSLAIQTERVFGPAPGEGLFAAGEPAGDMEIGGSSGCRYR